MPVGVQETGDAELSKDMDRVSLERALLDFEVANARVLDLTQRLVESTAKVTELSTELQRLQIEHGRLKAEHETMRSSRAFKTAARIWGLRNALGI